ncbi:MAG: AAA family ATPase [Candidatus Omnitrophica bacterium]|nr:AAA family ATPase [Candidatus Omnitrophota bacterium]
MRIITVANQKGGCGKTTTAVNLSACLADNNKKVLLIDLDPQSHATLGLNIKADLSMYNVLSKLTHRKAKLESIIQRVGDNFDIAPSSVVLSALEQELSGEIGRESRLWEILMDFAKAYDYVIIDCPPNLGLLTINAIRATDEIIVPVEASRFAIEGLGQLIDIMSLIQDRLNHVVTYRVLVVNFDSRLRHSFTMLEKIKTAFKAKMFSTIIHVNVKLKEAQNEGTHILNYDKYCRGTKDYYSLSRELLTAERDAAETPVAAPAVETVKTEKKEQVNLKQRMEEILKDELAKFQLTEVDLTLQAPDAQNVYAAGDFNNWKTDDTSMMQKVDGTWKLKVSLPAGRYRYRFVKDGEWIEDPTNKNHALNPYGQMDSLIEV